MALYPSTKWVWSIVGGKRSSSGKNAHFSINSINAGYTLTATMALGGAHVMILKLVK